MRKIRYLWLAIPALVGATTLVWVAAPASWFKTESRAPAPKKRVRLAGIERPEGARATEALALVRDGAGESRLIDAYRDWASDPTTENARRFVLGKLFAEENVGKKLSGVLTAIESDPTPVEKDPLWDYAVQALSEVWKTDTASNGMDLMFSESRPRARRALISSFAQLVEDGRFRELTPVQGQKLTEYFIDMHKELVPGQKLEVEGALRKVAGNDMVEILNGRGLGEHDQVLESEGAYKTSLAEAHRVIAEPPKAAGDGDVEE